MSFPQFVPQLAAESAQTTTLNVIKIINNIQTQLKTIFTYMFKKVQLDSIILTQIQLVDGNTPVPHTLGRAWSGMEVIKRRGFTGSVVDSNVQSNPNTYINITSSGSAVVDILVF